MTSGDAAMQEAKRELREKMRAVLKAMTRKERARQSTVVCEQLLAMPECEAAKTIMLFLPLGDEPDVKAAAQRWMADGKCVCVPLIDWDRRSMEPVSIPSLEDEGFESDRHGLRKPKADGGCEVTPPDQLDVVLVPGLAFDARGNRLGRGGGFYDRFLARLPARVKRIGVAFREQAVGDIPRAAHDEAVHVMVSSDS